MKKKIKKKNKKYMYIIFKMKIYVIIVNKSILKRSFILSK